MCDATMQFAHSHDRGRLVTLTSDTAAPSLMLSYIYQTLQPHYNHNNCTLHTARSLAHARCLSRCTLRARHNQSLAQHCHTHCHCILKLSQFRVEQLYCNSQSTVLQLPNRCLYNANAFAGCTPYTSIYSCQCECAAGH